MAEGRRAGRVWTLLLDNHDSYTYNLYQMLAQINGEAPVVIANDAFGGDWSLAWDFFLNQVQNRQENLASKARSQDSTDDDSDTSEDGFVDVYNIVVSPGPGHPSIPQDFGLCAEAIQYTDIPVLGVCLGHQGLACAYGGTVVKADEAVHGRTSRVYYNSKSAHQRLFSHIPEGFQVVRYHSLTVEPTSFPTDDLEVLATTDDGVIMALRHKERRQYGVQFHPEAICSEYGFQLLQNFRDLTLSTPSTSCQMDHDLVARLLVAGKSIKRSDPQVMSRRMQIRSPYKVKIELTDVSLTSLDFTQYVFQQLFSTSSRAFWLDSSNFQQHVHHRSTCRFSYMGDGSGPLSECVEYSVVDNTLRIIKSNGQIEVRPDTDLANYIADVTNAFNGFITQLHGVEAVPFNFRGGFVGYVGYEALGMGNDGSSNDIARRKEKMANERRCEPDSSMLFADRVLVFDHQEGHIYTLCVDDEVSAVKNAAWQKTMTQDLNELAATFSHLPQSSPAAEKVRAEKASDITFYPSCNRDEYIRNVEKAQELIQEGETYEVCLTNQVEAKHCIHDPLAFYELLRKRNPAPFSAYYVSNPHGQFTTRTPLTNEASTILSDSTVTSYAICCSSPERFLHIDSHGWMESKPIKGTRPRGKNEEEDAEIAKELATCEKDRAENMMIADLVRNDFGVVAQVGTVHVPTLMNVESYATVHQLVTTVRGLRRDGADIGDVLRATFPGGSMTGAPKERTMQIIRQLEKHPRGAYSGALGFISLDGSCDLNIIIRSAVITPERVTMGSGGAIVALSDPVEEYDEMLLKTKALVRAVGEFASAEAYVATDAAE